MDAKAPDSVQLEQLLQDSAWVRRLALALVGNAAAADDAAQDAWVAALHQVQQGRAISRGWWAVVLRNRLSLDRRSEERLRARESVAARSEQLPDVADTVERLEQQQVLLRAVSELQEPYRTTIRLRWLEGMSPAEIAARQGAPVRTVHTRLNRGLALLRRRLGKPGQPPWYSSALVALLRRAPPAASGLLTLMKTKTKLASIAALASLAFLAWLATRPTSPVETGTLATSAVLEGNGELDGGEPGAAGALTSGDREALGEVDVAAPDPLQAARAVLRGVVVDVESRPIAGAIVAVRRGGPGPARFTSRTMSAPASVAEARSDPEAKYAISDALGTFEIANAPEGHASLSIRAPGFTGHDQFALAVPAEGRDLGALTLLAGISLAGRVVDLDGRPVTGAKLLARGAVDTTRKSYPATWMEVGESDALGRFAVGELAPGPSELVAQHVDHVEASITGMCDSGASSGIELRLARAYAISGVVRGASPVAGRLKVRARFASNETRPSNVTTLTREAELESDGTFTLRGLAGEDSEWSLSVLNADHVGPTEPQLCGAVRAKSGATGVVLQLVSLSSFEVRVVDANSQQALDGVGMSVGMSHGYFATVELVRTPDGGSRFELPVVDSAKFMNLTVRAPGYHSALLLRSVAKSGDRQDFGTVQMKRIPCARVRVSDALTAAPIAGASVEAKPVGMTFELGPTPVRDGPPVEDRQGPWTAITNEQGEAVVNCRPKLPTAIFVKADGFAPQLVSLEETEVVDERNVEVALSRGVSVDVRVLSGTGHSSGVLVRLEAVRSNQHAIAAIGMHEIEVASRSDGVARFEHVAPGEYRVSAHVPSMHWQLRGGTQFKVDNTDARVELRLPPATELHGTLTASGVPLVGASIQGVVRQETGERGRTIESASAGATRSDSEGRFSLRDLEPGDCELEILHPRIALPVRWKPRLVEGKNEARHELGTCSLRGVAVDPDNRPIPNLELVIAVPSGKAPTFLITPPAEVRTTTDSEGAFAFEDLPPGIALNIAPRGGRHLPLGDSIVLAPGEAREDCVLSFRLAGSMRVVLDVPAGTKIAHRMTARKGDVELARLFMQANEATFDGLEPGTWSFTLRVILGEAALVGPVDVVVEPGQVHELRLVVP